MSILHLQSVSLQTSHISRVYSHRWPPSWTTEVYVNGISYEKRIVHEVISLDRTHFVWLFAIKNKHVAKWQVVKTVSQHRLYLHICVTFSPENWDRWPWLECPKLHNTMCTYLIRFPQSQNMNVMYTKHWRNITKTAKHLAKGMEKRNILKTNMLLLAFHLKL